MHAGSHGAAAAAAAAAVDDGGAAEGTGRQVWKSWHQTIFCGQRAPPSVCRSRAAGGRQERGSCAPQPDVAGAAQLNIPPETDGSNLPAKHGEKQRKQVGINQ